MKLIYKGRYNGEIEEFESSKNIVNATKYKEADTVEEMAKIITLPANIIQLVLLLIVFLIVGFDNFDLQFCYFQCISVTSWNEIYIKIVCRF